MKPRTLPLWLELAFLGILVLILVPAMIIVGLWAPLLAMVVLVAASLDRVFSRVFKTTSASLLGQMPRRRQVMVGTFLAIAAGVGMVSLDPSPWNVGVAVVVGFAAAAWMAVTIWRKGLSDGR